MEIAQSSIAVIKGMIAGGKMLHAAPAAGFVGLYLGNVEPLVDAVEHQIVHDRLVGGAPRKVEVVAVLGAFPKASVHLLEGNGAFFGAPKTAVKYRVDHIGGEIPRSTALGENTSRSLRPLK